MTKPFFTAQPSLMLTPATRLHIWMKPNAVGESAVLFADINGERHPLAQSTAADFTHFDIAPNLEGLASLQWDHATTAVSYAYAYDPNTCLNTGIQVLYVHGDARHLLPEAYHFRAPLGWMNDPNGFCFADGLYHLFYQHYPHHLRWADMHWGHATSPDLIHWQHQPIALRPNSATQEGIPLGHAFSGSAIATQQGLRLFFTDHVDKREPKEIQRSAVMKDGLHASPSKVILPELPKDLNLQSDFRDPFVFVGPDHALHMVVGGRDADGGVVLHYRSDAPDGADGWEFHSILWRDADDGVTVAECPCLVPISGHATEPSTLWALIYARLDSVDPVSQTRNLTRAVVGTFDGQTFAPKFQQSLDAGAGSYAWQAFASPQGPIAIGWLASWADWDRKSDFVTAMILPRRLSLSANQDHLLTLPVAATENLRRKAYATEALVLGKTLALPHGQFELDIRVDSVIEPLRVDFALPDYPIWIDLTAQGVALHRMGGQPIQIASSVVHDLRVFLDNGAIEVFAGGGRWSCALRLPVPDALHSITLASPAKQQIRVQAWELGLDPKHFGAGNDQP